MGRWSESDEEQVSPTARWFFRGVWLILFVVLVAFLIGALIAVVFRTIA